MTDPTDTQTLSLPHPAAGPQMRMVAIDVIVPSLTNQRKHFDADKLRELADSIAATGVHQPILLRPLPGARVPETFAQRRPGQPLPEYELICGERRWRACQLAGLAEVPAMIRAMDDAQALEAQIIENLQREDISALEEAEGYQALMQSQGINADAIGQKIGKSRAYVYSRLKILDLCEAGKRHLREGRLDFSQALPIARIPDERLQMELLEDIFFFSEDEKCTRSARELQSMVREDYMLVLANAPFALDDAQLRPSAGACTQCPHRTGANPDLFADVAGPDLCTQPTCFEAKKKAHAQQIRAQAREQGCDVIEGRAAEALVGKYYYEWREIPGHKRLDNAKDSPVKGKTLRKLIGQKNLERSGIKPTMLAHPDNGLELIACVTNEQAQQLLQMAEQTQAAEQLTQQNEEEAKENRKRAKEQAERDYEAGWRDAAARSTALALQAAPVALPEPHRTIARLLAQRLAGMLNTDDAKWLCQALDLGKAAPKQAIADMARDCANPLALAGAILACHDKTYSPYYDQMHPERGPNPNLMALAQACGVDVPAIQAQTQANARAAAAEAKKTAQKAAKASAPAPAAPPTPDPAAPAGGDTPQRPAARAGGGRGKARAQRPASVAVRTPEEAVAAIAAALQAAEAGNTTPTESPAAPAGGEGQPTAEPSAAPAGAGEPHPGPAKAGQGKEPPPSARPWAAGAWATIAPQYPIAHQRGLLVQLHEHMGSVDAWTVTDQDGQPLHGGIYTKYLQPAQAPGQGAA